LRAALEVGDARAVKAVASNPRASTEILTIAADRASWDKEIRHALLDNESTPPHLIAQLLRETS